LPKPVDLAPLRICLANLRDLQGLLAIAWSAAVGRTRKNTAGTSRFLHAKTL
jgi:hypothetical protein